MEIQPTQIWDEFDQQPKAAAATSEELIKWETAAGVRLPKALSEALLVQNGGRLRYSEVVVNPLATFCGMSAAFWDLVIFEDEDLKNISLIFAFGEAVNGAPLYFLNFNASGPVGEPSIYRYFGDTGDFVLEAATFTEFLSAQMAVTEEPDVSMDETSGLEAILHKETLTHVHEDGAKVMGETVVGFRNGLLWIYRHESSDDKETIEKSGLAKPFDPEAIIQTYPTNPATYSLRIDTRKREASIEARSEKMHDGKWKNHPQAETLCASIESSNKELLVQLRTNILGARLISRAEKAQREHDQLAAQAAAMAALPLEERQALGLEMAKGIMKKIDPTLDTRSMGKEEVSNAIGKILRDKLTDV